MKKSVLGKSKSRRGRPKMEFRVFLKKRPDGTGWRPCWYGRHMRDGKSKETSLCHWEGKPPKKSNGKGDEKFELSRLKAISIFKEGLSEDKSIEDEMAQVQKIHALRYGGTVSRLKIAELSARWDDLPHKDNLTEARRERVHSVLARFVRFMSKRFPSVKDAGALTAEHFKAYLADVDESGVSARTWNEYMETVRSVLRKLDGQSRGFRDYLANLPKRRVVSVHRRPFEDGELETIFNAAAENDPELHPVLVAAACTALRRGDVCRLQWDSVDLAEGFVTVNTSKTGETVDIPIFPPFRAVLEAAESKRKPGVLYVWPKIAFAYNTNPYSLNVRLNKVLAVAGFAPPPKPKKDASGEGQGDGKGQGSAGKPGAVAEADKGERYPAPSSPGDAVAMVDAAIRKAGWSEGRRQKGLAILQKHLGKMEGKAIAEELGIARGAVSTYLHQMEKLAKIALVSPPLPATPLKPTMAEPKEGEKRRNRANLCGWHSFRTTFCTLALANGVPMELLRKITGHRTAEIVLKHYDRRGREALRKAFGDAMPKAIAGAVGDGKKTAAPSPARGDVVGDLVAVPPELADKLAGASPAQWKAIKKILNK